MYHIAAVPNPLAASSMILGRGCWLRVSQDKSCCLIPVFQDDSLVVAPLKSFPWSVANKEDSLAVVHGFSKIDDEIQWIRNLFEENYLKKLKLSSSEENSLIELPCDQILKSLAF